jgi:hypothetical protein
MFKPEGKADRGHIGVFYTFKMPKIIEGDLA